MKNIFVLVAILAMVFGLTGCDTLVNNGENHVVTTLTITNLTSHNIFNVTYPNYNFNDIRVGENNTRNISHGITHPVFFEIIINDNRIRIRTSHVFIYEKGDNENITLLNGTLVQTVEGNITGTLASVFNTLSQPVFELSQDNKVIENNEPLPFEFGNVEVGSNRQFVFTIRNHGNMPLELQGEPPISSSNPAFTVVNMPAVQNRTIQPGAALGFVLRFAPETEERQTSEITIINNSEDMLFTFFVAGDGAPELTGTVSIMGTPQIRETLTANIVNLNGAGTPSFQWRRGGTIIPGATGNTYTLQSADVGFTIIVRVTRAGYSGYVDSNPTDAVDGLPALTGTVSITGNTWVGQTLTANVVNLEGSGTVFFEWRREGNPIPNAINSTYILQNADVDQQITVWVTRTGNSGGRESNPIGPITATQTFTWTANPVGSPTTTDIIFTFNADPGTLNAQNFTITPGTGSAARGTLSGSDLTRTLSISNVSAGTVTVAVNRAGIVNIPQSVTLIAPGPITWTATPVGSPTTTALTFTFSRDPGNIIAQDITITPGTGSATRGTLTGSGLVRTLNLTNVTAGTVMVSIDWGDVVSTPQTVTLSAPITWTATPVGSPTTTAITFTFSRDPGFIAAQDITITSGTGSATRGTLTGSGLVRTLNLTNVTAGTVMVSINWGEVVSTPQTVSLIAPPAPMTINITGIPSAHDFREGWVFLYDNDEYFVAEAAGTVMNGTLSVEFTTVQPGSYYIDVVIGTFVFRSNFPRNLVAGNNDVSFILISN